MKIWCFDDSHRWGEELHAVATRRGHDARLFDSLATPTDGHVFMHMHHHPNVRAAHKRMMQHFATNPDLTVVPDYRSAMLYDDKIEQLRQFSRWMPRTRLFKSPGAARRYLDEGPVFPFISKTSEGASSNNVRLIKDIDEAKTEIKRAFSDLGIKCHYGQFQHGYLYWQDFIPDNDHDIRIIAIGDHRLLLRRGNREKLPFASGSGILEPIIKLDRECEEALAFADRFFKDEHQMWCGIDVVKNKSTGKWYLLETTVGWKMSGYFDCRFFPDGRLGKEIWDVFIDQLEQGKFDHH